MRKRSGPQAAGLLWPIKLINVEMEIVKDLAEVWIALSNQESQ